MLTVACVLRTGKRYDPSHVETLRRGVERRLPEKHRFLCLTDSDVECERYMLHHLKWKGWWNKIELFKLPGPVLYLDLDTLPVGDLTPLARQAEKKTFTILRDFYDGRYNSSVMAWNSDVSVLYRKFIAKPKYWMGLLGHRGDQGFIEDNDRGIKVTLWQDVLPGHIVSYKASCRKGVPDGARVVCLHGRPKFSDMDPLDPVRIEWEENGRASKRSAGEAGAQE